MPPASSQIAQILSANHARVLDFFRNMDHNNDGVVSKGEFGYAIQYLGLNVEKKQVDDLFDVLDPSGDGYIEYGELKRALLNATKGIEERPERVVRRPPSRTRQARPLSRRPPAPPR